MTHPDLGLWAKLTLVLFLGNCASLTHADDADPVFGLYDQQRKEYGPTLTIAKADVPQDGKYHLYKMGRWRILPGTRLWGHKSWTVGCLDIEYAYRPPGPDATPDANDWDVWVSAKFTGPAYIRGSPDKENGYYMDRVILVRPGADVQGTNRALPTHSDQEQEREPR